MLDRLLVVMVATVSMAGCGSSSDDGALGTGGAGAGGGGDAGGGGPQSCAPSFEQDTIVLAAGASVPSGTEQTLCFRWTAPENIDISGFVGTLGPTGHHALLITHETPSAPDGLAPCDERDLMDVESYGDFQMLAGVSYESDGDAFEFPSSPVQVGLFVAAGTQLIFDAHFTNATSEDADACSTLTLQRGKPVIAKLQFRTVLPAEQYGLTVPAGQEIDVVYEEPVGDRYRVAAASSHMHVGGTRFRMSVAETGQTLHETTQWAEPEPTLFHTEKVVVEAAETFRLECSFENPSTVDQHFPDQMCVGGMYLLPCTLPGAC